MLDELRFIEKPDSISWDTIHQILYQAHEGNRQQGVFMRTAMLSGEELKERIGKNGKCFVVMDGNEVIATASVKFVQRNTWYHRGTVADLMLCGILPKYKGQGLYRKLLVCRYNYAKNFGVNIVELDTAEGNTIIRHASVRNGFKYVAIKASPYTKHYSVVLVNWLDGCPYSDWYLKWQFIIRKWYFKLRYKPGHVKRFGI